MSLHRLESPLLPKLVLGWGGANYVERMQEVGVR